jgi:ribosomal protein L7Ae-like RNA K-turn-binding protein
VEARERIRDLVGLGIRARSVTIGSRETRAALHRGAIRAVLVATDGSPRDRERLARIAQEAGVPVRAVAVRAELGAWTGRASVAVLGIRDGRLASRIVELAGPGFSDGEGVEGHAKDHR